MPVVIRIATDSTCPVPSRPARLRSVIIVAALAADGESPPSRTSSKKPVDRAGTPTATTTAPTGTRQLVALSAARTLGQRSSRLLLGPVGLEYPLEELMLHVSAMRIQPAEDPAMMQQHDPISYPGHLIQMLAGQQDRDPVLTGAHPQQLAEASSTLSRIRASKRL